MLIVEEVGVLLAVYVVMLKTAGFLLLEEQDLGLVVAGDIRKVAIRILYNILTEMREP